MKERIKHILLVLLALFIIVGGISLFLYNASYNPSFSMIDVLTGATKKKEDKKTTDDIWEYTLDDLALSKGDYQEVTIVTKKGTYQVLENTSMIKDNPEIVLITNQENKEYQQAVTNVAEYLKEEGYQVSMKECSETMMLSLVHAGHFDLFLLSEVK